MSQRARNILSIAALIGAVLMGYEFGHHAGYGEGRCKTFAAFVTSAGYPHVPEAYPPECRSYAKP